MNNIATSIMTYTLETTKNIQIANIAASERLYEPSQKQIDEMAASLKAVGQLTAIMVHPITRNSWRIVAGGTRLRAAFKLGWTHIRADIISGPAIDYKIIELAENAERRSLTADQRKQAKAELRKLIREKLATVEAAKGGRGKKGGRAEAARQMGIPESTARDAEKPRGNIKNREVSAPRATKDKPAQNHESRPVPAPRNGHDVGAEPAVQVAPAAPAKPSVALDQMLAKTTLMISNGVRARINRYNEQCCGKGSFSDCTRGLLEFALDTKGF